MTDIILLQTKSDNSGHVSVPMDLLFAASFCIEKGYKVKIIDQRIDDNWKENLKNQMNTGAKLVLLSANWLDQIRNLTETSKLIISTNPSMQTIFGGKWAMVQPGISMQDHNIDFVCYGESDNVLNELMENIEGKKKTNDILGIYYRPPEGAAIKKTEPRIVTEKLDEIPRIPWGLVNINEYSTTGFLPGTNSVELFTSKGNRAYSIKKVIEMLETLDKDYKVKNFFFRDEAISHERFLELINSIESSGKDYNWGASGVSPEDILKLNDETMNKLAKSGCEYLEIDLESGNQRVLGLIKKGITVEAVVKANRKISNYQIIVRYKFRGGFPTETEEEFSDTLKLMKTLQDDNKNAISTITMYVPFPGNQIYDLAVENGYKPPKSLKDWSENTKWYKKDLCWLTKSKIKHIENAVLLSTISNKRRKSSSFILNAYYPFARYRYKNGLYGFMIEKYALKMMAKLNEN